MSVEDFQAHLDPVPDTPPTDDKVTSPDAPIAGVDPQPVPDDHPSKLGRKVSKMEEKMDGFLTRFDSFLAKMETRDDNRSDSFDTAPDETPDYVKETVTYLKKEQAKERELNRQYEDLYVKAINAGVDDDVDEDLHKEIVKELLDTNFGSYVRVTRHPEQDANINYRLAMGSILKNRRKVQSGAPNVRGANPTAPTDVSSRSSMTSPAPKKVALDEFAQKFIKSIGASEDDEWVQAAVSRQ